MINPDPLKKRVDEAILERLSLLVNILRGYLQDEDEVNHLIEGKEFKDEQLLSFLLMALDYYNNIVTPRSIQADVNTFPSLSLWLDGAAIFALKSAIFKYQRNSFQYNDSGTQVVVEEKAAEYERTLQRMLNEFMQACRQIKENINMEECYGGFSSEYLLLYTAGRRSMRGMME